MRGQRFVLSILYLPLQYQPGNYKLCFLSEEKLTWGWWGGGGNCGSRRTILDIKSHFLKVNPIHAGVWGHNVRPLFLLYFWSNYHQAWHDGTLEQNLSKSIIILMTSSLWGTYGVIKQFSVSFQVKIRASLIFCPIWLKFATVVNFEELITNLNLESR